MADWPVPSITPIEGTWLAELDSEYFNEEPGQKGFPGIDGYMYVGPRDLLLREPLSAQAALDDEYHAELERRATAIQAPPQSPQWPQTHIRNEQQSTAFSYEPDQSPGG